MTEYVELNVDGPPEPSRGLAVLLPGLSPRFAMPLLLFAARAVIEEGWRARLVDWDPPDDWDPEWAIAELKAAVGDHDGPVLVVGKSLATTSARYAAEQRYDAIWLTPLLRRPDVAAAITRNPGRQLLVGGDVDPSWNSGVAAKTGADVLEIAGADHGLIISGDAVGTAQAHVDVTRRIVDWLGGAPTP